MSTLDRAAVEQALAQYQDPYLKTDLLSCGCLRRLEISGGQVEAELVLGYAAGSLVGGIAQMLQMAVENVDGVTSAKVSVRCEIEAGAVQGQVAALANVKNVIAVASTA